MAFWSAVSSHPALAATVGRLPLAATGQNSPSWLSTGSPRSYSTTTLVKAFQRKWQIGFVFVKKAWYDKCNATQALYLVFHSLVYPCRQTVQPIQSTHCCCTYVTHIYVLLLCWMLQYEHRRNVVCTQEKQTVIIIVHQCNQMSNMPGSRFCFNEHVDGLLFNAETYRVFLLTGTPLKVWSTNKLASLGYASPKLRNYDLITDLLTGVKCRATSVAKKLI